MCSNVVCAWVCCSHQLNISTPQMSNFIQEHRTDITMLCASALQKKKKKKVPAERSERVNIRPGHGAFTYPARSPCWRPRGESLDGCGAARRYINTLTCLHLRCSLHSSAGDGTAEGFEREIKKNKTLVDIVDKPVLNITVFKAVSRFFAVKTQSAPDTFSSSSTSSSTKSSSFFSSVKSDTSALISSSFTLPSFTKTKGIFF